MRRSSLLPLLLAASVAGCDRGPAAPAGYDAMPRLTLSPLGELCVGRDDPPCQFANARIAAAAPDGRVAVADLPGELREFDGSARYVRTVGGRGGGPGEYRLLVAAGYDSTGGLTILDQRALRVQRFDTAGRLLHASSAPMLPGTVDAAVVGGRAALFVVPGAAAIGDTVAARVVLVDPATGDTTALPGLPEPAAATGDGTLTPIPPPFSVPASSRWAVSPDGALHLADPERLRIVRRDAAGAAPRVLVDLPVASRPVSAGELEAEKARYAPVGPMPNTAMAAALRRASDAAIAGARTTHPMVSRLVILDDGTLLAREGARPGADSVRWNAFAADGVPVGHLVLSAQARVAGGRLERLVVVQPGESDVPRIGWFAVGRD